VHGSLPNHPHPPMCLAGFLSEASERHKPEKHVSERTPPWCLLMLLERGRALRSSERTRLQHLERAQQLIRAVHAAPNAPLSVDERCDPAGLPQLIAILWNGTHQQVCVCELSWERLPCGGAEWACWLRSPPPTRASPVTGGAEPDRCQGLRLGSWTGPKRDGVLNGNRSDSLRWLRNRLPCAGGHR
jgi:hypothetical protein